MSEWSSPKLQTLAAEAEAMTPALWEAMKEGYRHVPVRPAVRTSPSRARLAHDRLGLYGGARLIR